jgi:RNA polymerase sigma-70 factor (ECF subfamily)
MPRVRRTVLLSCGPIDDADDLVQRVMVRVLTRLDSFRGEASFLVWVDRITVNEVRSHYRRRRLSLQRLFEYSQEPWPRQMDHPVTPEDQLQQRQLLDRLAHHVARLRPNQRLPVVLHMLHGYTIPEIAAMLEIEVETAKKRLQRGRRGLLQRLRRDPSCSGMHPAAMREGD